MSNFKSLLDQALNPGFVLSESDVADAIDEITDRLDLDDIKEVSADNKKVVFDIKFTKGEESPIQKIKAVVKQVMERIGKIRVKDVKFGKAAAGWNRVEVFA